MKSRLTQTIVPSFMTYRQFDGRVYRLVTAKLPSQSGQTSSQLSVISGGVASGGFKTPTAFKYEKIEAAGLRGRCFRLDAVNNTYQGAIERTGGFYSVLGSNSRIGNRSIGYTNTWNDAVSNLNERVRGGLDLSIDLFQAGQTLKTAKRIYNLTDSFVQHYRRAVRGGAHRELASLYLEWTYGVAPLLQDVIATIALIDKKARSNEGLVHFRGRGHSNDRYDISEFLNIFTQDINVNVVHTVDQSVRCQIDVYLSPKVSRLQTIAGYTSLNPIAWLYEMTPWSFVVDWFWNLGAYLRNLETALIYMDRFVAGCVTYSAQERTTMKSNVVTWGVHRFTDAHGDHLFRRYDRQVLSSYPLPRFPRLDPKFGSRRVLNAAALLSQLTPELPKGRRTRFLPAFKLA